MSKNSKKPMTDDEAEEAFRKHLIRGRVRGEIAELTGLRQLNKNNKCEMMKDVLFPGVNDTDKIFNSTPKTIKEKILHFLVKRGFFAEDAVKVFELYKQEDNKDGDNDHVGYMEGRWDDLVSDYPIQLMAVMFMGVERVALEYIKEHIPKAWFRPMFENNERK